MLVTIAIAFGLYRLYRYRVKNILAIERIREKIASDFHDDIGSALSSISIFSEVVDKQLQEQQPTEQTRQMVGNIASQSRAMLDAMDDIIWAVNPKNDHFNDLAVRMHEFAVPLLEARNIAFDININEDILNTQIKMAARKNIFLIFKECINNILKHSCCTVMQVSVKKINNQVELIISDNGKGFDVNAPHSRNGLLNMKKRADEIGGVFYVTTQSGKGTLVKLLVNII
jgi:signal transduction histidine kinase